MGEFKEHTPAVIVDWLCHMKKEETVQHMEHSQKYVENSNTINLFVEQTID